MILLELSCVIDIVLGHSLTNLHQDMTSGEFFNYPAVEVGAGFDINQSVSDSQSIPAEMDASDYLVAFSTKTQNYCVGIVDMVDSTKISAQIGPARISRYYQVFLNSMSKILSRFGGFVIKNIGDCLVYYFPESSKPNNKFGFMSCLESSLAMIESHDLICEQLRKEGLPCVDYRISADYGSVILMKSNASDSLDLIGPPVNMCSKINRSAGKNGVVLGGDLHSMVKDLDDYNFKEIKGYSLGFKYDYPIFTLSRKNKSHQ